MSHSPEEVIVLMSVATTQADVMNVGRPRLWYGSQVLGDRFVMVVEVDVAHTSPTWPGDLLTFDDHLMAEWLAKPSTQGDLGNPPVLSEKALEPPPPATIMGIPVLTRGAVVPIGWWVDNVRAGKVTGDEELGRTPRHEYVWIMPDEQTLLVLTGYIQCDCGISIPNNLTACPDGVGCSLEDDND